jgi:hypothetical protein
MKNKAAVSAFVVMLCLVIVSCKHSTYNERKTVKYIAVDSLIEETTNLIYNDHPESVLTLEFNCPDCSDLMPSISNEFFKKQANKSDNVFYALWTKNGESFIKKIDAKGTYKTIKRPAILDFHLVDYFLRNRQEIITERPLHSFQELSLTEQNKIVSIGVTKNNVLEYKKGATTGALGYVRFAKEYSHLEIKLKIPNDSFARKIALYQYRPITSLEDTWLNGNGNSGAYANNDYLYYHNQMKSISIWIKLIEANLFEVESQHEFICEKSMSIY